MVHQDVGRLDIPVHHSSRVQKINRTEYIINEVYNVIGGKWLYLIRYLVQYLSEVALHVLHDHEQVGELELRGFRLVIILANDNVV